MAELTDVIVQTIAAILGQAGVVAHDSLTTAEQTQIAQAIVPGAQPACLVYPSTQAELAEVVACAAKNRWRMLPAGHLSKLSWGGLSQGVELIVSTQRLDRLIDHAVGDLTITVEAGISFATLQSHLAKVGQFLPLDPAYADQATIGGIVATADTGAWRQRYGGVRDLLIGITFVRADGNIAKAGGRVVKNVAGYDLMKLLTGSYGTLGIIAETTFRVYPFPEASQTIVLTGHAESIAQATQTLLSSALTPTAIDLLSHQTIATLQPGTELPETGLPERQIGLVVRFQSIPKSVAEQGQRLLELAQSLHLASHSYEGQSEAALWHQYQQLINGTPTSPEITCKIGVRATAAVATLVEIDRLVGGMSIIHAGSGLGFLRYSGSDSQPELDAKTALQLRSYCHTQGGFLSLLQAPHPLKQHVDVWGYTGNALGLLQKLKHQFDPENLLSPHRFVNGI